MSEYVTSDLNSQAVITPYALLFLDHAAKHCGTELDLNESLNGRKTGSTNYNRIVTEVCNY